MMFFIITTDVIGPTNAPYAFSTVGFVGGVLLYLVFGLAAYYGSFLLLNLYLRLDSTKYPIHTFGELFEVFFGKVGHYLVSLMQITQIIFIVGSNNIANAQSMTLLTQNRASGPICFIVSIIIWAVIGFVNSVPFRSLRKLSYISSLNVFLNIFVCFLSMGFIAHSPPNYAAASSTYGFTAPYAPIATTVLAPPGPLSNSVNGAMNMVFGWSGLMIFVEFMNEMRRPWEFWKSFTLAEGIVLFMYLLYGAYVYGLQGQYTLPVAYQGVSSYVWQSIGNGLSLWTYTMASVTYLNIGVKIIYWLLFEECFRGPPLMSTKGFFYWTALQAHCWILSFVIGTAIPQVQTIQALIGAAILLQFSYTFPPLMQFAFDVQADASKEDGVYSPVSGVQRYDSWWSASRWRRGLFGGGAKRVAYKWFNAVFFIAALATSGLGIWGSVETIIATFKTSAATSFGCTAPV
ncbi:transmembrane amino acid transporter protein-domain-containing protein [Kockovaella imperatae]|uniref:Transmembrane amino acid transporter protein-domain-containing protein n=1 Tax=Kockovaella imperatae TaxID=4999 RepID=A0A1Y1UQK1_9TREE|nr:transmembrane amino acid transporter protein-domain-containing protein [Kockovaella imperatae]ORX40321.1 transmembrane amino acid transporter protein-domain-containing protein [Kockovaella imperatae]